MTLLKFAAEWCGPCKTLTQVMKGMKYTEIDVDSEDTLEQVGDQPYLLGITTGRGMAMQYSIRSVPTLILIDEDMKEVSRLVGLKSREQIDGWLEENSYSV